MPLFSRWKLRILAAVFLLSGVFLLVFLSADAAQAAYATSSYQKQYNDTLTAQNWNDLFLDYVPTWTAATMTGPLFISGSITATNLSGTYTGTMGAQNVSSGAFGSNTGGGNYSFPGDVGIGTTTPTGKLDVLTSGSDGGFRVRYTGAGEEWFSVGNTGAGIVRFGSAGGYTDVAGAGDLGGRMNISTLSNSGKAALVLTGVASPTANLFEVNNIGDLSGNLFVIDKNGSVGIGTTNPVYKLDVQGTTTTSGINTDIGLNLTQVTNPSTGSLALVAGAGNVDAGLHNYQVTFTTALGETNVYAISGGITTDAGNGQVLITLPVSTDPRVTGRKLYRTKVGAPGVWQDYYLATIPNNTDTTYQDNIADASLTLGTSAAFRRANTTNRQITINGAAAMLMDDHLTAVGTLAGSSITYGGNSAFFGSWAGKAVTIGYDNNLFGYRAAYNLTTGSSNTAMGDQVMSGATLASQNSVFGYRALYNNVWGGSNTVVGYSALYGVSGNSNVNNTVIGTKAGYVITTGSNNILLGYQAADALTTGTKNIVIGYDIDLPEVNSANMLNIGNLIYATGLDGSSTTLSTGNVGIGTTNPGTKLDIVGSLRSNSAVTFTALGNSGNAIVMADNTGGLYSTSTAVIFPVGSSTLPFGTSGQTLRHNGTVWTADSNLYNNGTNVGIGTTDPTRKLEVLGNIGISGNTNPYLLFNDGTETYYAQVVSGVLNLGHDGATTLNLNNQGNVGIGTTDPLRNLSLYVASSPTFQIINSTTGSTASDGLIIQQSGATSLIGNQENGDLELFVDNGASNRVIQLQSGTGNVGIGTTDPGTKLDLPTGALRALSATVSGLGSSGNVVVMADNTGGLYSTTTASFISGNSLDLWKGAKNGNIWNGDAGSGNVGIGTTDPGIKLSVVGGISGFDRALTGDQYISFFDNSVADSELAISNVGNDTKLQATLYTSGGTWKNLLLNPSGGNVGIGTTTPGAKLQVNGDLMIGGTYGRMRIYDDGSQIVLSNDTADRSIQLLATGHNISTGYNTDFVFANDSSKLVYSGNSYLMAGNVGIGTTDPGTKLDLPTGALRALSATVSGLGSSGNVVVMADNTGGLYSTTTASFISGNSLDLWKGAKNGNIWNGDAGVGSVGIGTTNPGAKLSVSGGGALGSSYATTTVSDGNLIVSGYVGVNLTDPGSSYRLNVNGTINSNAMRLGSATLSAYQTNEYPMFYVGAAEGASYPFLENGNLIIQGRTTTGAARDIIFATGDTTPTAAMTILRGGSVGIGTTDPGAYRLKVSGNVAITGTLETQTGSDFAEEFKTDALLEPGTVVVMGDYGYKSAKPSTKKYDNKVIGVVSDNPSIIAGRSSDPTGYKAIVAMVGVVKVKVSAVNGAILKGDLLTSSSVTGQAMKASVNKQGTIIGKALEDLVGEAGEIKVLVNLQ